MLNIVWAGLILGSFLYSFFAGTAPGVGDAIFQSCQDAVSFMLKTGSIMIMWSGFMAVAESSGLTLKLSKLMSPIIRRIFKGVKKGSEDEKLISSNLAANMLGLSNAATPLGMKAMKKLSERSKNNTATDDMCMLCVINCASIQLIPSTLIALRSTHGSLYPADIIVPIWIASAITVIFAISAEKMWERGK